MTTVYLIVLCLALGVTVTAGIVYVHDRLRQRGSRSDRSRAGDRGVGQWYDGTLDRLLVLFPIAGAGLLIGLALSRTDIDLLDLGAEAMLLASGATATERLVARQRSGGTSERPVALVLCLAAGLFGGLVGLGG